MKTEKKSVNSVLREILYFFFVFIVVLSMILVVRHYVCTPVYIPSESMCDTLQVNDMLLVSKVSYKSNEPERQDIVVFNSDEINENETVLIKRIIGLPGDKVEIVNGDVYINGKYLDEPYAKKDNYTGTFNVPKGKYLVLGDNRNDSLDSRFWDDHYLDRKDIIGKAIFKYYPKIQKMQIGLNY